ncbi:hypothetical protein Clacol_000498 [Clathrus columnatus]|uniref:Uncharacterized protein n=1 Tax=Clathrus columnatus TaxID=1419009 RepID=A0AAV4ZYK9_9AGAM|nr:hypothetical protein Clacol_000498 [Clathrus columnatus]
MDDIYVAYAGLITLATVTIYAGAWGSLPPPRKPQKSDKKDIIDDEDEEPDLDERISSSDAYIFPIIASVGLLGFYLAFKYLSKEWINWLLRREKWNLFDRTQLFLVKNRLGQCISTSLSYPILTWVWLVPPELLRLSFRTPTPFLLPLAVIPSVLYVISDPKDKPPLITNILGLSFAFNALCLLKLDSFKTGSILLAGLFIYDIWWVFGTEVMVQVAKTLDVPIKILWPKAGLFSKEYMLLGLGDIVIPGAFITLALRRDLFASPAQDPYKSFKKPYFHAAILAYVFGLTTTIPACILSFLITAVTRGELHAVWNWSDDPQKEAGKVGEQVTGERLPGSSQSLESKVE